jgi:small subunit ribosomal protein S13
MIRIAGKNLLPKKKLKFALSPIVGIGKNNVNILLKQVYEEVLNDSELSKDFSSYEDFLSKDLGDLKEEVLVLIRKKIDKDFLVEEDLVRQVRTNIGRIVDLGTLRGLRHKAGMAVRGQRTRRNMQTRRKLKR